MSSILSRGEGEFCQNIIIPIVPYFMYQGGGGTQVYDDSGGRGEVADTECLILCSQIFSTQRTGQ